MRKKLHYIYNTVSLTKKKKSTFQTMKSSVKIVTYFTRHLTLQPIFSKILKK